MKDFAARFGTPLETVRPRGGRVIEGFSAKLQRRIRLFSHSHFAQWIRLEADPSVIAFCERPARVGPQPDALLVDFWVDGPHGQTMLLLDSQRPGAVPAVPSQLDGIPVRTVAAAELAAAAVWISNWSRMLPVVNATRSLLPTPLLRSVLDHVQEPISLARLEHELSFGDPSLARGAIFEQLRLGRICAPSLHTQPLGLHTQLEPLS
ncbi:hypothetical protein QTI66_37850 [Variovorax sp. J22R133]|uniref:hypothetical protein n=1 Tax=Variovorax brevis TaxID=3053503 RepID=UPI0025750497|nr:hypothetical protein [Variovorax sp. J22R133]MDM0117862.1 hypothetical protein [Variovorax sp. J22R133]